MTLLRCATHVVRNLQSAIDRYIHWLDFTVVETGQVPPDLAASWLSPSTAGCAYAVLQPASGVQVFLRFIEGDAVPGHRENPMRTYGWSATEICVQDVDAVNGRMSSKHSPFEVIGPPRVLDGFPHVKPMQVRGRDDGETIYLTAFPGGGPENGLPSPKALIDRPFIMVLGCGDLRRCLGWVDEVLGLPTMGPVAIRNSMMELAFGLDVESRHELATVKGQCETFLELDQLPPGAWARPRQVGALPPGVAITTMMFPDFDRLEAHWAVPPVKREGEIYAGRRVGMLTTPEGALLEVVES